MTQRESAIEQINLGYNNPEDRLLLRIGMTDKSEMSLWISRRVCRVIWSLLQNISGGSAPIYQPAAIPPVSDSASREQALASFAQEVNAQKSIENMDFHSAYIADRQAVTEQPLLVVDCTLIAPKDKPAYFSMQCANTQVVKIALNNELVYAMTNMLQLATREAGWDLLMVDNQTKTVLNLTQQVLH